MKSTINRLISSVLLLILIPVLNSCHKQNKCSVFCNVHNQAIENEALKFYLDKTEKPVKINGSYYAKYNLESKKYDTLSGYWGREGDTIFFINDMEEMNKFPMLIISKKDKLFELIGSGLALPRRYYFKINDIEYLKDDTIFFFEHETVDVFWKLDIIPNAYVKYNKDSLSRKDEIEKRTYKLSLNNGILDYKVEKGIIRRTSLPYKYKIFQSVH